MPLTKGQIVILQTLAASRDPESYVAGSTPLNVDQARFSGDIDIFHDSAERVASAADLDANTLAAAGFRSEWARRTTTIQTLLVNVQGETVKLEWVADSDFRFFPTVPDPLFGYMLHPIDLATNKVHAAAGRRALRDLVDLVTIDRSVLPLGPLIWAAVEKSPGFTPEGLIAEIRRNALYPDEEWRRLASREPIDPDKTLQGLRTALDEAEAFVSRMPTEKAGVLFLDGDKVVQPDPDRLGDYVEHRGRRRGHWPSNPDIAAAMMARYRS